MESRLTQLAISAEQHLAHLGKGMINPFDFCAS
jgi:hypothetical protein